jgi:hypothetical protein
MSAGGKEEDKDEAKAEKASRALDAIYSAVLQGVPKVSKPLEEFAADYLDRHKSPRKAADDLVHWQIAKCGTSGFVTGLGGLLTLPVAIPANLSSVLYVQLRMVAAIAYMGGYDVHSDQVQTLCYLSLVGDAAADILKQTGTKVGEKMLTNAIGKVSGATLTKINQRVGFRLITKFGEKGVINLGKAVPLVGGVVGGGLDAVTTNAIAHNAIRLFLPKPEPIKVEIQ